MMNKDKEIKASLLQQRCVASVLEAEDKYSRTGEAIDFEEMMTGFKQEFKW